MTIKEKVTNLWNSYKDTEKPSAAEIHKILTSEDSKKYSASHIRDIVRNLKEPKDVYLEEVCEDRGIPSKSVKEYWVKTPEGSLHVEPGKDKDTFTLQELSETFSEVLENTNFKYKVPKQQPRQSEEILRVIISDIHVGMETDETGYGLYSEVWNEEELFKRLDTLIDECSNINKKFKEIHVIDLGDFMDGWNGYTTRGGHKMPQNMSNRRAFDVGVRFKVELYNRLQALFNTKVVAYNICNDNHSSDFGFITNEAVRHICNIQNPNIEVNNIQRFIYHYIYGDHCFIICHGKDQTHMKYGFKPKLDPLTKDKIVSYIKNYGITSKYVTFEKGDSHLQLLDSTSSQDFEYNNYRAFSPASGWVAHNFGKSTSGFTLMVVRPNTKSKVIVPFEF